MGGDQKNDTSKWTTKTPCEAGLVLGPADSRPALYASLCLLFGGIPGNSAPGTTNLWNSSHNKLGGRKAHTSLSSGDMHCRFLPFLSLCCRASCLLCGRCCAGACLTGTTTRNDEATAEVASAGGAALRSAMCVPILLASSPARWGAGGGQSSIADSTPAIAGL